MARFLSVLVAALVSLAWLQGRTVHAAPRVAEAWATVPLQPAYRFTSLAAVPFNDSLCSSSPPLGAATVTYDPTATLQPIVGFGAALTETTAYNFIQLRLRNESAYWELLESLFGSPSNSSGGIGISFLRVPITSCDLSLPTPGWSFDDVDGDVHFEHFNASHIQAYQIPVLKDIVALSAKAGIGVKLLGSPWSAPAWMKTSKAWGYGRLQDDYYSVYANYLVKVAQYFDGEGLTLWGLTLQNEPRFEPGSYPGTAYTAHNESVLASILTPRMRASGLPTRIVGYDHNWDDAEYPSQLVDEAGQYIDYIAWHCYAGDVSNQTYFHNKYPSVPLLFTECSQTGNEGSPQDFLRDFLSNQRQLYFSNLNNWGQSTLHWSLGVDRTGGPHSGGCADCSGVVVVDASNTSEPYFVKRNSEFYSLAHFSALVPSQSTVVKASVQGSIAAVVINTPDRRRVVQLLNEQTQPVRVIVTDSGIKGACLSVTVPAQSQVSLRYPTSNGAAARVARTF